MTTLAAQTVHICAPAPDEKVIVREDCPTCLRRSYMIRTRTPWYGCHWTCLRCGEEWADGERLPRPFARGWRKRNREMAKRRYRSWMGRRPEARGNKLGVWEIAP